MNRLARQRFTAAVAIRIACLALLAPAAGASERVHDQQLGFTLSLPSGFQKHPALMGATPDIVHAFILGDPADDRPDVLLFVERLRGTLGRERLKASDVPPGFKGALITARWKQLELDGFEVPEAIQGSEFVTYNVQVPLRREAIQLKLFGPMGRKDELRAMLDQILAGLDGESNWIPSAIESTAGSRKHYGVFLLVVGIASIAGGLMVLWLISRRTPKGTALVLAVLIYIAGSGLSGIRVREVVLLCGILKMIGSIGTILGIVDLLRKRGTPDAGAEPSKPDPADGQT